MASRVRKRSKRGRTVSAEGSTAEILPERVADEPAPLSLEETRQHLLLVASEGRGFMGQLAAYRQAIEEATKKEVLGTFVHFPVSGWWVGVETGGGTTWV